MKLWQNLKSAEIRWADEQPNEEWITAPTMPEDELRSNITDAEYDSWFAASAIVDGIRMGPRDSGLLKTHERSTITVIEASPDLEIIVGYLPNDKAITLTCDACGAEWDGRKAVWSKAECDGGQA